MKETVEGFIRNGANLMWRGVLYTQVGNLARNYEGIPKKV